MEYYPPWAPGPFRSNEERLCSQALMVANVPGEVLQAEVRPPLQQINPFPPRFGYPQGALTISQVLNTDRVPRMNPWHQQPANPRRYDYSGTSGEINASARNVSGDIGA